MMATTSSAVVRLNQDSTEIRQSSSLTARALRRIGRDYLTMAAICILGVLVILTLLAPVITNLLHVDAETTNPSVRLLPPGSEGHILGTDDLGRDYAARLLYGGQVSMAIGFSGAIITLGIGMVTGLASGYFGGTIDDIMNWVITTLDSIPGIYLLLLISSILQQSPLTLVLVISLLSWTGETRLIRGQTLAIRDLDYVLSARATGASAWRIMFVHILPNTLSLTFLTLASGIGSLILLESTLSFLKLGVQPPTPTWGNMLSNAQQFFSRGPHMATISGILIFVTVLCLFVIGDGLRDAFDPTTVD